MVIELAMYFALGFFCAIILALLLLPSIWRRAVRLTRKRIAATTPVTLSEFRAEKDQLRAKNALELRKLELQLEDLRKKRAAQLRELTQLRQGQEQANHEREDAVSVAQELEERNLELVDQVRQYEIELTNLSQKLRYRERDLAQKIEELDQARAAANIANSAVAKGYDVDVEESEFTGDAKKLSQALAAEKRRNAFLEEQLRASMNRVQELKSKARTSPDATLSKNIPDLLDDAENHIAIATERFNALLRKSEQDAKTKTAEKPAPTKIIEQPTLDRALATELQIEDDLEDVGARIQALGDDILARFGQEDADIEDLRERLEHIAIDISHIVYAQDSDQSDDVEESLFDRVRKYANDGLDEQALADENPEELIGRVADRMDAMKKASSK